jgi:hypothetical protein
MNFKSSLKVLGHPNHPERPYNFLKGTLALIPQVNVHHPGPMHLMWMSIGLSKMRARTPAVKEAYLALSEEERARLKKEAKIKANTFAYIEEKAKRNFERKRINDEIMSLMDELESKCGDDAVFYSVPKFDPGVNSIATSHASYCLTKMEEMQFSKHFVIFCSETVDRLAEFNLETLRSIVRRQMHLLMSKSEF